jgi:putative PIN family toxin of toxin-antitoxin system
MILCVLDTSVLVAGLRSNLGASFRILSAVADGEVTPCVSTALFLEYEDVLLRADFLRASGFSRVDVLSFLRTFASASKPVEIHFRWRPQLRDPNDEFVLEATVNSGCRRIVTHNIRDFIEASVQFDVSVLTPGQFVKRELS